MLVVLLWSLVVFYVLLVVYGCLCALLVGCGLPVVSVFCCWSYVCFRHQILV